MIAEGRGLYVRSAARGATAAGAWRCRSLIDATWKCGSDDDTLYKLIKGQIPQRTMPTVYNVLPDDQVWKILAFIRSLYIGDPAEINW